MALFNVRILSLCFTLCCLLNGMRCDEDVDEYVFVNGDVTTQSQTGISFTRWDILRLRNVLKKLPMNNPQLRTFHELIKQTEGDLYLDMNALVPDLDQLKSRLINDLEYRETFGQMLASHEDADDIGVWNEQDENIDPEDIPEEVTDRNQTQGYAGCKMDYDMVIKPLTENYRRRLILWWNEQFPRLPILPPNDIVPDYIRRNPVARRLEDAHGRRPTGFLEGNLHWPGTLEECMDAGVRWYNNQSEMREFHGKYARLDIPVVQVSDHDLLSDLENLTFPLVWPFAIGVCVPDTCNDDDIIRYITKDNLFLTLFMTGGLNIADRNITWIYTGQPVDLPNDIPAQVVVGVVLSLGIIGLIAACYDGWGRHSIIRNKIFDKTRGVRPGGEVTVNDIKRGQDYLYDKPSISERVEVAFVGFSFFSNFRHIYSSELPTSADWHLPTLDGIRGISFLWALHGLTYVFGPIYFETWCTTNLVAFFGRAIKDWRMMPTFNVYYANYSFFFVSGFLCVYMWYRSYERNNRKITFWFILRYFLHRWWSLMPTAMALWLVFAWYYRYLGDGPFTSPSVGDAENCKESWWMILTWFNNLFNLEKQCFGWAWYFSIIWQLHIVSIFVVVPLVLKPLAGYIMLALMYIAHLIVHIIWLKKASDGELSWYYDVLQTPWCNAGPFCIGMMFAIIYKTHDKNRKWHWTLILLLWMLAISGLYAVVFVPWQKANPDKNIEWSEGGEIAYDFLAPQILALCVGWIFFACEKGYGGFVAHLLKWNFWIFMSKMMYPFSIFIGPLTSSYFTAMLMPFYIHESSVTYVFYGHLISLFVYANAIALLFHFPLSRGFIAAVRSKTRLEAFLYGNCPDGLRQFTGELNTDKKLWETSSDGIGEVRQLHDGLVGYVPHGGKSPDGGVSYQASTGYDDIKLDEKTIVNDWLDKSPPPHYGHANTAYIPEETKTYPAEDVVVDDATTF